MQTIFRVDLRKLQSSDPCIPRHLLSHGLAAVRAQAASESAGVGGPKPTTRPDRRGLETGGRDLPRRARDSGGASCPTDPCQRGVALLKLKVTRLAYRKCPDPPRGSRRAGTSRAPEAGPLSTPPAIALSHGRSTSG